MNREVLRYDLDFERDRFALCDCDAGMKAWPEGDWVEWSDYAVLLKERDELREWQRQMVEKAADKSLAGYRELAGKCAQLEAKNDELREQAAMYKRDAETISKNYVELRKACDELHTMMVSTLRDAVAAQKAQNDELLRRNQELAAEVQPIYSNEVAVIMPGDILVVAPSCLWREYELDRRRPSRPCGDGAGEVADRKQRPGNSLGAADEGSLGRRGSAGGRFK